jgi:formylmethanofuran dehydrogenase subunit D
MAFSSSALAARPFAVAAPGTYSCKAATAANQVKPPPPLWETTGKLPTAEETAAAEATKPLCPAGEAPSAVASTHEATADRIAEPEWATTTTTTTTTAASASRGVTPPADPYGGENCNGVSCYWYVDNYRNRKVIGMEYATTISEPHVSSFSGAHSIDQLALEQGEALDTVEAGWDVDPGMWTANPSKPHFFVFINKDKYEGECETSGKCYDDEAYWTPLEGVKITMGEALEPSSAKFDIGAENFEGNWWIWAGKEWIGYVSGSFWGGKFTKAERASNYGEVNDNEAAPTTAMGDGQFGASVGATMMTAPVLILSHTEEETTGMNTFVTNSELYSLGDINKEKTSWHFGGPGLDPPAPPKSSTWAVENTESTNMNVFYENTSRQLANEYWTEGWSSQTLTGGISGIPTAIENLAANNMNVFYGNESGQLVDEYWVAESGGNGWSSQTLATGVSGTQTATVNTEDNNINVFYKNTSGQLANEYWTPSGGWVNQVLTSGVSGTPVAVENVASNNMNVFYKNTSGQLADEYWTPSGGWANQVLASGISGTPVAIENKEGNNMNVFYENTSGQLADEYWVNGGAGNGWSNQTLASGISGTPTAVENSPGTNMNVFYKNASGQLVDEYWINGAPGNGWASQTLTEGGVSGTPGAIENGPSTNMNVFYRNMSNQLVNEYWVAGSGGNGWSNQVLASGMAE